MKVKEDDSKGGDKRPFESPLFYFWTEKGKGENIWCE